MVDNAVVVVVPSPIPSHILEIATAALRSSPFSQANSGAPPTGPSSSADADAASAAGSDAAAAACAVLHRASVRTARHISARCCVYADLRGS